MLSPFAVTEAFIVSRRRRFAVDRRVTRRWRWRKVTGQVRRGHHATVAPGWRQVKASVLVAISTVIIIVALPKRQPTLVIQRRRRTSEARRRQHWRNWSAARIVKRLRVGRKRRRLYARHNREGQSDRKSKTSRRKGDERETEGTGGRHQEPADLPVSEEELGNVEGRAADSALLFTHGSSARSLLR